mmetsp:Transcript_29177/g.27960  ORF Transcript_29177/g.27960 Transcript_29177/m.27960 type:complete len:229 (+) Transcript_29177:187-873(+)|eukprot:CAMPEP_0119041782 /NCGR_PEP_ID=MMETSP1177-20130426/13599_1 /TAXON_ID=2985 /ORGANISM="Ochromonas sp, Strain CCMP1899" /LENGTH=228 /DNA_ID=CAMNT_0007008099 /DNA_START=174 /DNA_END=860 /DNA_ORIENTATION=-
MTEFDEKTEKSDSLLLSVDIPKDATPGKKFHVALNDRTFEVTVPEGVEPGQSVNIIVPQNPNDTVANNTMFNTVEGVKDAAVAQAKGIDESFKITDHLMSINNFYKVSERATAVQTAVHSKLEGIDTRFDISQRVMAVLNAGYTRAQAINESRGISQGAVKVGDKIIAFATEIDRRLALSATSARIVVTGANVVLASWRRALAIDAHLHLTERLGLQKKAIEPASIMK